MVKFTYAGEETKLEDNKKNKSAEYEYPTPEKPTKKGPQYALLLLLAAGLCLILALGMKIALDSQEPASSPSNTEPVVSVPMPSEEPSDISSTVSVSKPVSTPEPYYKEPVPSQPAPPQDTSSTVYLYTDSQNVSGQKYVVKAVLVR